MAKAPADSSRIPVFNSAKPLSRFSRPLANLSNKVRAHLSSDSSSKHRQLFGILGPGKSSKTKYLQPASQSCPSERPARPTRFFESFDRPKEAFSLNEVGERVQRLSQNDLGRKVCVSGHKVGVLRYLGKIEPDPGVWCGVEFFAPVGLNDGSVRGVRYFTCPPLHGVLVPASKVALAPEEVREYVSDVSDSGPHSLLGVISSLPSKRHSMGEDWLKEEKTPPPKRVGSIKSVSQVSTPTPSSTNSGGLIWDLTIGSQHSSSAGSLAPSARALSSSVPEYNLQLSKHSSFEFDDSLGILTPDQMADFTMNCTSSAPRTPSAEDVPFLIQDLDFDKENDSQRRGSKRSSLEMQCEEASVSKSAQQEHFNNVTLTKRDCSLEEKKYTNEIVMEEPSDTKTSNETKDEIMEQEAVKDLSEDTEMSDSNPSKKNSAAMSISYEPGSETVSNSENMEFIRINRTPSLEDLPMDKMEGKLEVLAGPSKNVLPPPTSFVTSVTSIASLDNGYQGDGEWSRPASRGADHSPLASKVRPPLDPMTDSDFFTESDADMHDETSGQAGSGTGRGDRRAQVIDGTLYGGVSGSAQHPPGGSVYMSNQANQRCPAFTPNTEEMDSSGIYSDLERKTEEPCSDGGKSLPDDNVDETNENEKDFSPEGSTRTGSSMKSDMSQTLISPAHFTTLLMEQVNTIRNLAAAVSVEATANTVEVMEDDVFVNTGQTNEVTDVLSEKTIVEVKDAASKKREEGIKKYKMPKRNVVSKIKTMITSNQVKKDVEDENQENRRPMRTQRKNGRWDAVMNKIAQGKEEEKTKPSRLKEVKSKVFAGITNVTPVVSPANRNSTGLLQPAPRRGLTSSQSVSTRSLRDVSSLKSKSRRSRTRGSECSLPAGQSPGSQPSSRNSSLSDVSVSKASPQSLRSKKRDDVRSTSPQSDGSTAGRAQTQTLPARLLPPQKNGGIVAELKSSPVRKPSQRRPLATPAKTTLRDLSRVNNASITNASTTHSAGGKSEVVAMARPPPQPQPSVRLDHASRELHHAAQGVEALGVLLNYLVYNLDAFSTPQLKKDLDKMRADWLSTKLQMEEVRVSYLRSEEEKNICQKRLQESQTQLQSQTVTHQEEINLLTASHEKQVKELEWKLNSRLEEVQKVHTAEVTQLRQEHAEQLSRVQAEADRRQVEQSERLAATQAELDSIKQQSRRLLDSMHEDKDSKLQVTAGRCKVLSDEVASLRAVLELRSAELQELRRTSELAQQDAAQLPSALQRVSALQARVEDLETQLQRKIAAEQTLAAEKANMEIKVQLEDNKNKRLSQYNEELMWKLRHSSEVMSALTALSQAQDITATKNVQLLSPYPNIMTPKHCHAESHLRNGMTSANKDKEDSPPQSPKVKGVVEKSDSVSWVLDLDESPTNVASRLVRRAHSMRVVQSATPSPAHIHSTRTLPNPHKRQRSRTSPQSHQAKPQRARSFSFDSDSSEVPRKLAAEWDGEFSPGRVSTSPGSQVDDNEDIIVVEMIGEDRLSFLDLERHIDREKIEVMGGEDFASPKLSSSSGGSETSVRSRRNDQKIIDNEDILMINRVDGLISSLPKESAGEAMISEETSDNDSGTRDSDEEAERYCSDEDSLSGSASLEMAERRMKYITEHKINVDLKHSNLNTKKGIELIPGSESGSLSIATTAMDLSWSEEIDLIPSESEG